MDLVNIDRFLREEDGTTSVEYAVVLMLILLAVISAVQFFGSAARTSFEDTGNEISGAFGN